MFLFSEKVSPGRGFSWGEKYIKTGAWNFGGNKVKQLQNDYGGAFIGKSQIFRPLLQTSNMMRDKWSSGISGFVPGEVTEKAL